MLLSARNTNNNDDSREIDGDSDQPGGHDHAPLFAEGQQLFEYISQLEAIMDTDSDFLMDETSANKPQRLFEESERVVLGDWMDWGDESLCVGGFCGDDESDQCDIPEEYKVAAPKVDVMAFLGIRRAEPLQVSHMRDWD